MNANAMVEAFQELSPERQEAVGNWMMVQRLIAEHAGVSREEWFALIQEALDNPLDFGFVEDANRGAGAEADPALMEGAQRMLGQAASKTALEGEGIRKASEKGGLEQELFQRFQAQKIDFEQGRQRPRPKKRPAMKRKVRRT